MATLAKGAAPWLGAVPPPAYLWLPATLVAAGMALPLSYLGLRTLGAGPEAWELLGRGRTLQVLLNTALLALAVTASATAIAVPLAWLTARTDLPARGFWSVVSVLPLVIPSYVGGFALVAVLAPKGMLQQLLAQPFGVERLPEIYGFPGAWLALTLFTYPYVLLTVRAALLGLDPALEEVARSLGCGARSAFWRVTLPQLRPAIAAGCLLVTLYTLSDFGAVSLLQFDSFTRAIYLQYQASLDRHLAALLSLLLVGLTALVLLLEGGVRSRARYHRSTPGVARPSSLAPLGRWRWPAVGFCGLVALLALGIPIFALGYWLWRGLVAGEPLRFVWGAALNSVYASGLAAGAAVVAVLPLAILSVRYSGPLSVLLERVTYAGFALPGIVIALALVFFAANYATPLYQTLALLVVAYVIRFLPQALGAARSSLLQVSPSLEEAARGLGRSGPQALLAVTVPLMRPGISAGGALVFLTAMKELPATLLLSPIGFETLATIIWGAASEGFFARAAAPALLLILVASVPASLFLLRGRGGGFE